MLYPKTNAESLVDELFQNPTKEYRGAPFWAWNCKLQKEELLRQLDVLKEMGMGGAHIHVRRGMETPYLGEEHMDLVRSCLEKCKEEDMLTWLYDEDRWPSGFAGGMVTKDEEFRQTYLLLTPEFAGEENLLTCYDIVLNQEGCLSGADRIEIGAAPRGDEWYAYVKKMQPTPGYNNQTYVDTLNLKAIRRFLEVTHERYAEAVGQEFGGVIPAIFTDEPQFSKKTRLLHPYEKKDICLPWTADLPESYKVAYGCDILDALPELVWQLPGQEVSVARYRYHDHVCQRFTEAFADQCGTWCRDHGLLLTGHVMDEATLQSQTQVLGEAMRSYRSFGLPGIDMLCNKVELTTAKQAQSAARQYGREGVLSEMYGVTGWDFDFRGHKFQGDWQAAMGVTARVHHLSWVSMKGEAKRDYPASINYQSPWWRDYRYVEDHFARLNTALTRGKPLARVGVIHPIESYWLHFGPEKQTMDRCRQLDENFENLTKWLLDANVDFDFISESLLPELCPKGGKPLQVGQMAYDVVVLPECDTIRSTTLERLEAFQRMGGRLVFLGAAPRYENAVPSQRGAMLYDAAVQKPFSKEAVQQIAENACAVDIREENGRRAENLIHQLRQDGEDRWLFIAHREMPGYQDSPQKKKWHISMQGEYSVRKYDTVTGKITPIPSVCVDGKTAVEVEVYELDSLLLRYVPREEESFPETPKVEKYPLPVEKLVEYTMDEPNVYLLDKAEYALNSGEYQPEEELLRADMALRRALGWPERRERMPQPWTEGPQKPEHTVRLRFTVHSQFDISNALLALENAEDAQIICNGKEIAARPDGWYVDKAIQTVAIGSLKAGKNTVEVILPFGRRTGLEWCYLLGDFSLRIRGEYRELTARESLLGFDDVTRQGLVHYGGNITYQLPVTTHGGGLSVTVPCYAGAAIRAELDGETGYIAYPPYNFTFEKAAAGDHVLKLTLLGNRNNSFGPLHKANAKAKWIGPNAWYTAGIKWTPSYRLSPLGIMTAPILEETLAKSEEIL